MILGMSVGLYNFACHYHSCRDRKWTDCCRRNVRFTQTARHNGTISFHHSTYQSDRVSFSHPRLHAGFGCWNCGDCDPANRAVCFVQRAPSRRMALDLRDYCCRASLYLNVFVLVVQSFVKVSALTALAPTQSESPFAITQAVVLAIFILITLIAVIKFRPGVVDL